MVRKFFKILAFGWVTYTLYSIMLFVVGTYYLLFEPILDMLGGAMHPPTIIIGSYLIGWIPHPALLTHLQWDIGWFGGDIPLWLRIPLVLLMFFIPLWLWWRKQTFFRAYLLGISGGLIGYANIYAFNWKVWTTGAVLLGLFYMLLAWLNELRKKKFPDFNVRWLLFWHRPWT